MKINSVAIIGAGAIGSYFVWGLSEKLGDKLWIVASGDRKIRLENQGIDINNKNYKLNVKTAQQAKGADLLLVATKYGALKSVLDDIKEIVTEDTVVMSLLNGVDSEEIIAETIDKKHIVYSIMKIAAERRGHNIIFDGPSTQGIFFGDKSSDPVNQRIKDIAELFDGTDIHYNISEDILQDMWFKYALNISKNLPQAIINCGTGAYKDSEYVALISKRLRDEVVAIAAARGIDISSKTGITSKGTKADKRARYSTLQDLDAKNHTEIDMFSGAIIKMGQTYGIPVPYNEFTYNIIKSLEEKNDGLFDYE